MNIIQEYSHKCKQSLHIYNIIFCAPEKNCLCRNTKFERYEKKAQKKSKTIKMILDYKRFNEAGKNEMRRPLTLGKTEAK